MAALDVVRSATQALQDDDIAHLLHDAPSELVPYLQRFGRDEPAYRVVVLRFASGSINLTAIVGSALLSLAIGAGGNIGADIIQDTPQYKAFKERIVATTDTAQHRFPTKLDEIIKQRDQDKDAKFGFSVKQDEENLTIYVYPKKIIKDEPTLKPPPAKF